MNKFIGMSFEELNKMASEGFSDKDELLLFGAGFREVSPRGNICDNCARYFDCNLEVDCSCNGLIVTACPWYLDGLKEVKE